MWDGRAKHHEQAMPIFCMDDFYRLAKAFLWSFRDAFELAIAFGI